MTAKFDRASKEINDHGFLYLRTLPNQGEVPKPGQVGEWFARSRGSAIVRSWSVLNMRRLYEIGKRVTAIPHYHLWKFLNHRWHTGQNGTGFHGFSFICVG